MLGVDVILEFGSWRRGERAEFRRRAEQPGARSELHFTDASEEELLRRLAKRKARLPPGTFWMVEYDLYSLSLIFYLTLLTPNGSWNIVSLLESKG